MESRGLLVLAASSALAIGAAMATLSKPTASMHQIYSLSLVLSLQTILYSTIACNCAAWRACVRGFVSVPLGAVAIAFFAVVLGVPFEQKSLWPTLIWSFFMATLMIAPAGTILGLSWQRWRQVFAFTRPRDAMEILVCVPAHGAALGAWIGAWPMPLDWDRDWQQWPISCTYGATGGYLLGSLLTFILFFQKNRKQD